ncbi:MAG: hypothetical protein COU31_04095 [Candidatus Magasanikbacteria bacterium CG10_big_fil_rev_8_21_14_0_10_40_10]|uniref:YggT family protein n=1 Tax=Candidatus Magasanikbacteria bacterium CG10_big_fil_rev_8_21_14_0_10_40_10 TaxID=1974648 RepID=A0A2M6W373_9BACT|nr:MAG: hypothetical protein COU31_04095 [Candidatus Magasanikbacteria bacterium CG10_big_fil_rev_8_21_14_0_10_40_10]
MLNLIETILITIFSILPNADPSSSVLLAVNNAFATVNPIFAKINLVFPIFVLFKVLLLALFVEMTLFLFGMILKAVQTIRG